MARPKKKRNGEDPGLNMGTATAVAPAPVNPLESDISTTGPAKRYEVIAPVEIAEEGSDEIIEMPAEGRVDLLLTEAEAAPALESGAIRERDVTPDPFDGVVYYRVVRPFTTQIEGPDGALVRHDFAPSTEIALRPEHAAEYIEDGLIVERPATPDTTEEPKTAKPDALAPILIEVVAPSLNRPKEAQRLEQALATCTVPEGYELKINVQRETEPRALPVIVNELVAQSEASIVVVLADHIVPKPGLIEAIVNAFHMNDESLGMVGLNIVNMPPSPGQREYCFFALTREFINHFPDRQIFCPDYYHFYGDTELGRFASDTDVFFFAKDAEIETHHVNNGLAAQDDTWRASRSRRKEDLATFEKRQAKGLLWGASFDRVNA